MATTRQVATAVAACRTRAAFRTLGTINRSSQYATWFGVHRALVTTISKRSISVGTLRSQLTHSSILSREDNEEQRKRHHFLPWAQYHATFTTVARGNNFGGNIFGLRNDERRLVASFLKPRPVVGVQFQQTRNVSWLPEVAQNISIWGGSGWMINKLHGDFGIPYWACFSTMNIMLRLSLIPVVIYASRQAATIGKIIPDVAILIKVTEDDLAQMRARRAEKRERVVLAWRRVGSVFRLFKLHDVKLLRVFLSPILQFPFFLYLSIDMRKIVNGLDPELAQELVDNPVAWIPDLTAPDPMHYVPIMIGCFMYLNLEVSLGRRSQAGSSVSKSIFGITMKDGFQSFSIFMPAFVDHLAGGIQIYSCTGFAYTIVQSAVLRNEEVRKALGLPSLLTPPEFKGQVAPILIQNLQSQQESMKLRYKTGEEAWGKHGILEPNYAGSLPGTKRASTIVVEVRENDPSKIEFTLEEALNIITKEGKETLHPALFPVRGELRASDGSDFVHGVSATQEQVYMQQLEATKKYFEELEEKKSVSSANPEREYVAQHSDEVMERANRGERVPEIRFIEKPSRTAKPQQLSLKRIKAMEKANVSNLSRKRKGRR